jgi:hypothetical protein
MHKPSSPHAARPDSLGGTPSQRDGTRALRQPAGAGARKPATPSIWTGPGGYMPNLHEALARAEQRRIRVTPRINWTTLAVAAALVFLLGIAAIAVPAMLLAGVTL